MRNKRRGQNGQSIVEFALLLPVLLIILLGLLDLGRVWHAVVTVHDCAGEGALYAAIRPDDLDGIRARAAAAASGLVQVNPETVAIELPPNLEPGAPVTVTVPYTMTFINPLFGAVAPNGQIVLQGVAVEAVISTPMGD
ncbi:MAG TPA: pilus assembly protein [Thermoflexia bacterium]|nr:pilus assembly protein [Thermoflexia bacterium]